LLQYFVCRARNALRNDTTHRRLLEQHAAEFSSEPPRAPDDTVDDKRWAAAFDASVRAERRECDAIDAAILDSALIGLSLDKTTALLGIPRTTTYTRLRGLRERLRGRILAALSPVRSSSAHLRGRS